MRPWLGLEKTSRQLAATTSETQCALSHLGIRRRRHLALRGPISTNRSGRGPYFNNVSIATNDYTVVVWIAVVAFASTLLTTALSWRWQRIGIRIWCAFIAVASVLQLFDAVGRRLPHLLP